MIQYEMIQLFFIIAICIIILILLLQWLFIYTAVKHGVKKALEDVLYNTVFIDENEEI